MAVYGKGRFQSILDTALGVYLSKGFRLTEIGDSSLLLGYRDGVVGVFYSGKYRATIHAIRRVCREHLESLSAR